MSSMHLGVIMEEGSAPDSPPCLNCGAPIAGAYCAACGQREVDLTGSTWHLLREALSDATDLDGRVLNTVRAIRSPGRLTVEFLRGRRMPYLGPLKLFLIASAALSATWVFTRSVDARFYGYRVGGQSASAYIDTIVRGLLAAGVAIAVTSWLLSLGRRRLLDEAVFALNVIAAVALWSALIVWLSTAWKFAWTTGARVPPAVPSLLYLLFLPALVGGLLYIVVATRRVHGVAWWAASLRALVFAAVGIAAVRVALLVPPL